MPDFTLKKTIAVAALFVSLLSTNVLAQDSKVAIGTEQLKDRAVLWLKGNGTNQGLLLPVVSNRSAFTGLNNTDDKGMFVYDLSDNKVYYWNGTGWTEAGGGSSNQQLSLSGNTFTLTGAPASNIALSSGTPTTGQALVWNGSNWLATSLNGDVSGTQNANQVVGLKGKPLPPSLPVTSQALVYNGTAWVFQALPTGGGTGDLISTNNLSDLSNVSTARTNLGLGTLATQSAISGGTAGSLQDNTITDADINSISTSKLTGQINTAQVADGAITNTKIPANANIDIAKLNGGAVNNNKVLKIVGGIVTYADDEIGAAGTGDITAVNTGTGLLGGAGAGDVNLTIDVGTTAGKIIQLDGTGKLPAVDGSQLTNIPAGTVADGSITGGTAGAGVKIAANTITNANINSLDAGKITSGTLPIARIAAGAVDNTKLAAGIDATKITVGILPTARIDVGTTANKIVQLDGTGKLPAVDGSQLTNLPATVIADGSITTIKLADNAVTTLKITDANVTSTKLANNAVTTAKITDASVTTTKIAPSTINGQVLTTVAGATAWATPVTGGTDVTTQTGILQGNGSTITGFTASAALQYLRRNAGNTAFEFANLGALATLNSVTSAEITNATIVDADVANVSASKITTGTLPVARGGTNITSVVPGGIAYGGATDFAFTPVGTVGQFLQSNGAGIPTWITIAASISPANLVIKGNAAGTAQVASQIFDDGTNVGIGTTTPAQKLHLVMDVNNAAGIIVDNPNTGTAASSRISFVSGGANAFLSLFAPDNRLLLRNIGNGPMIFSTQAIDRLFITGAGNIGINNIAPTEKLDVAGNLKLSGALMPNNLAGTAGQVLTSAGPGTAPTWSNAGGGSGWNITGNTGTTDGINFIGTTDDIPLTFKVNNQLAGRITSTGEVFFGYQSGMNNTAVETTAIGFQALFSNTSGSANTASGNQALFANTTGAGNTANGYHALSANTTGIINSAFGTIALQSNTTGNYNTGIGGRTLSLNTIGSFNTAIGVEALFVNTTGTQNTAVGVSSLRSNTVGGDNTAIGDDALSQNTDGSNNVAIGRSALSSNISGSNNIAIGAFSDISADGLNNATAIGFNAKVATSNSMVLGGMGADAIKVGIGTTTPLAHLHIFDPTAPILRLNNASSLATSAGLDLMENNGVYGTSASGFRIRYDGLANKFLITSAVNTTLTDNFSIDRATGNVGIGTTSSASQLHLLGGSGAGAPVIGGGALYIQDNGGAPSNGGSVLFGALQGYWAGIKGLINNGGGNTTGDLAFYTRNAIADATLSERLRITNGGKVVIDPVGASAGTIANGLVFGDINSGEGIATKRNAGGNQYGLDFFTNSVNRMSITNGGNLGIGITSLFTNSRLTIADGHIQTSQSTNPTISVNTTNSSGTASLSSSSTDVAGVLTFQITTSNCGGCDIVTVNFNKAYQNPPVVIITPANVWASVRQNDFEFYVTTSTSGFQIRSNAPPVNSNSCVFYYFAVDTQ